MSTAPQSKWRCPKCSTVYDVPAGFRAPAMCQACREDAMPAARAAPARARGGAPPFAWLQIFALLIIGCGVVAFVYSTYQAYDAWSGDVPKGSAAMQDLRATIVQGKRDFALAYLASGFSTLVWSIGVGGAILVCVEIHSLLLRE